MADRDIYELQCFVNKLWSLRSAGQSACLTVESRDYELLINLQLNLPRPVYSRPGPRPRPSPSRARRRARRVAAAAEKTDKAVQLDLPILERADAAVQADPPPPSKPTQSPAMPTTWSTLSSTNPTTWSTPAALSTNTCTTWSTRGDDAVQAGKSLQMLGPPPLSLRVLLLPLLLLQPQQLLSRV